MKKKTSTRVEPGELVHIGDKVYMASSWDKTRPCSEQCHLHDGVACNGYCFRWDNTEEVVFRFILPTWWWATTLRSSRLPTSSRRPWWCQDGVDGQGEDEVLHEESEREDRG